MRQLAARVRRVHQVLARVARLRVADIDGNVVAAFSEAVNKLKDNAHILSAETVPGTTQAQVTVKPESYTSLGIDPRAKPEGHVFVSLEEGPLENGILELDVSCGRSHVLVDVKKGQAAEGRQANSTGHQELRRPGHGTCTGGCCRVHTSSSRQVSYECRTNQNNGEFCGEVIGKKRRLGAAVSLSTPHDHHRT